jgi:uncharacterized protein (DUF2225 family)
MSDSTFFNEAQDALYQTAKASANFIEAILASKDTDIDPADKQRLKVALSVLKITWSSEDDDDEDEDEDQEYEYEDDEFEPHAANNN